MAKFGTFNYGDGTPYGSTTIVDLDDVKPTMLKTSERKTTLITDGDKSIPLGQDPKQNIITTKGRRTILKNNNEQTIL